MDPLEQMLAGMGQPEERGLEFSVDPGRVRETLATLVKADPLLWFKHFLQLLYDVPLEGSLLLSRQGRDGMLIEFEPSSAEVLAELSLPRVKKAEAWLLGHGKACMMARLLCEVPGEALLRHHDSPGLALLVGKDSFEIRDSGCGPGPGTPERGLSLEFPLKSLMRWGRLYGYAPLTIVRTLHYLAGLHPSRLRVEDVNPLPPEWPFPLPVVQGDEDMPTMWDWESVQPASEGGFLWTVSAWAEVLEEEGEFAIERHPLETTRSFSGLPMLGCYPTSLASRMSFDGEALQDTLTLRAERVFGVSWTASAPKSSELYPILRGVPGRMIPLEGAPPGLYLLADASHLRTDASGLDLVRDQATEEWLAEQVAWIKGQTRLYAPFQAEIPRLWMQRVRSRAEIGRRPGLGARLWKGALSAIYAASPVRGIIQRRMTALTEWSRTEA